MTKEQIIAGLQNAAKPYEEYYIEDDLIDAINQYPEPFELVEPILEIIGTNPLSSCQIRNGTGGFQNFSIGTGT